MTSVAMYNLLSSAALSLPMTCMIAVRKDWGLKNLEIMMTLGISRGLFLNSSNWLCLYSRFISHEDSPLLEG